MLHSDSRIAKMLLGVAAALAILAGVISMSATAVNSGARAQISAVTQQMHGALERCDAQALAAGYTEDARMIGINQIISGHDAILSHMETACPVVKDFRIEDQELFDQGDTAVETGVILFFGPDKSPLSRLRYMSLWKKTGNTWQIHRTISVPFGAAHSEQKISPELFVVRQTEPAFAVVLPMTGSHAQHEQAIARLREYLAKAGVPLLSPPFGMYHNSPDSIPDSELRWEVGYVVPRGTTVAAPFETRDFPSSTVVSAVIEGPHKGVRPWNQLGEWTVQHGYAPAGPPVEVWFDGPRTEMILPVAKQP